ncbi:MAG: hypothetical protein HYV52_00995 [Parcubacteria group bacterium]|nr:hypothetical protein [Parcubacteria group bacterium]
MFNKHKNAGFATLLTIVIILGLSLIIVSGFSVASLSNIRESKRAINSSKTQYVAEAGIEDSLYRIIAGKQYTATNNLAVGEGTAITNITDVSGNKIITSLGNRENIFRKLETKLSVSTQSVQFFYGAQIGEGGATLNNGAEINGNVYSNGNIVMTANAKISGGAIVAGGIAPTPDQQWTIGNSDFPFGLTTGTTAITVDEPGDIGDYNALTLGSDGLARISYYDASNNDLKYVRCTSADCVSKNITTIDSSGDVGFRYTSIAIALDGLARISYYNNTNGDLKYVQCANDDCTTKNIATIDSSGDVGQFNSLALGTDGLARISYYAVSGGNLKFLHCLNDNCSLRNTYTVDSIGDVGKYTSIVLDQNNIAMISYLDETNDDLKFTQCLNVDCSAVNNYIVDSTGDVGQFKTSIALGSDELARISYYDDTGKDLKYAQCLNISCTLKNITIVDSADQVGKYSSLRLNPADGLARISYYDATNGAAKFARCLNDSCSQKNISTPDTTGNVGLYTSLAMAQDGFGQISYRDDTNQDLKFLKCADPDCNPGQTTGDAAQSFIPSATNLLRKISLNIKKIGSPGDATVRIMANKSPQNVPDKDNTLTTGTLYSSMVTGSYGWVDAAFVTNPTLNIGQTYWIVIDAVNDSNNYWVWAKDNTDAYVSGTGKFALNWDISPNNWSSAGGDLDFKTWMAGTVTKIDGGVVSDAAQANTLINTKICGDAYFQAIDAFSLNFVNNPTNPDCANPLTPGMSFPGSSDPSPLAMPISDGQIDAWKTDAQAGGVIAGDYNVTSDVSLGPKKITGNLNMTSNNRTLTVTGTIYIAGNIDIANNSRIRCDASYGINSCVVVADGWIHISNNGQFAGSGQAGSYIMLLTTAPCKGTGFSNPPTPCASAHHEASVDLHNSATGIIFYAKNGLINLHNTVNVTELSSFKLALDNNAVINYEQGLQNAQFTSGPSAGYKIEYWKEVP